MQEGSVLYTLVILSGCIGLTLQQNLSEYDGWLPRVSAEEPWLVLPDDRMDVLCPNSDICSTKLGYTVTTGGPACCGECSCEPECQLKNNCCFPELGPFLEPPEFPHSCVYPITKLTPENRYEITSFYMVDQCPGDSDCDKCGDKNVAEWGSLYPVYSRTSGLIYKNPVCANCYNETDVVVWHPLLIVKLESHEKKTKVAGHFLMSGIVDSRDMLVRFLPPREDAIDAQQCYKDVIDSCEHDYQYHIFDNLTDHALCHSGLWAPYFYGGNYYANIFCAMCIMPSQHPRFIPCNARLDTMTADFAAIFDNVTSFNLGSPEKKIACSADGKRCKEVLCPVGHIRKNGDCVLTHAKWLNSNIQLLLEFSTQGDKNQQFVSNTDDLDVSFSLPYETKWTVRAIIVEREVTGALLNVYADLVWEANEDEQTGGVTSADVLYDTKNLIKKAECFVQHGEQTNVYQPSFSKYSSLTQTTQGGEVFYQPLWVSVKESSKQVMNGSYSEVTEMVPTYMYTKQDSPFDVLIPVPLGKLYFCENIYLSSNEFISFYNRTQLYYRKTGTYLFDGEFANIIRTDRPDKARICLEDSEYRVLTSNCDYHACSLSILLTLAVLASAQIN